MQATRANATFIPPSTVLPSKDDSCLNERTAMIALAIFASLTGFVFLPFGLAFTLTAIVTIGAIAYCNERIASPSGVKDSPLETTPPTIEFTFDDVATLRFSDQTSLEEFNTHYFTIKEKYNLFSEYTWSCDLKKRQEGVHEIEFKGKSATLNKNRLLEDLQSIYRQPLMIIRS